MSKLNTTESTQLWATFDSHFSVELTTTYGESSTYSGIAMFEANIFADDEAHLHTAQESLKSFFDDVQASPASDAPIIVMINHQSRDPYYFIYIPEITGSLFNPYDGHIHLKGIVPLANPEYMDVRTLMGQNYEAMLERATDPMPNFIYSLGKVVNTSSKEMPQW